MTATDEFDPAGEARRIAFDHTGHGKRLLLLSGFPHTRPSRNKMIPNVSHAGFVRTCVARIARGVQARRVRKLPQKLRVCVK
jgi:hypothetical protein